MICYGFTISQIVFKTPLKIYIYIDISLNSKKNEAPFHFDILSRKFPIEMIWIKMENRCARSLRLFWFERKHSKASECYVTYANDGEYV